MAHPVKLDDILEGMEFASDEARSYLSKKTGEVFRISDEEMRAAEEDEPLVEYPDWQQEYIKIAQEILENDDYIPLPDKYDIHEYDIMEKFCLSINDDELRDIMYYQIKGSGAFRRFKDNIFHYDIEEDWYKFREEAFREIAVEWCEYHKVPFIEK